MIEVKNIDSLDSDDIGLLLENGRGALIVTAQGVAGEFSIASKWVGISDLGIKGELNFQVNTTEVSVNEIIDGKSLDLKAGSIRSGDSIRGQSSLWHV